MDVKALIAEQTKKYDEAEPAEVEVLLGGRVVTVVIPFMWPRKFDELAAQHPAVTEVDRMTLGFNLDDVARHYPDVTIRDGDEVEELLTVVDKAVHYGWGEVYDLLGRDDRHSIRAVIWGLYMHGPSLEKAAAKGAADA